jgi:hypothetical protein
MSPHVTIAKELKIVRNGFGPAELYIDGVLFPYATVDGFSHQATRREMPTVHVAIVAEKVAIVNDINAPREDVDNDEDAKVAE